LENVVPKREAARDKPAHWRGRRTAQRRNSDRRQRQRAVTGTRASGINRPTVSPKVSRDGSLIFDGANAVPALRMLRRTGCFATDAAGRFGAIGKRRSR
jgi:hypothetical protein